jgi:hypothetical protein
MMDTRQPSTQVIHHIAGLDSTEVAKSDANEPRCPAAEF